MRVLVRRFLKNESGQDLTEWALILAFISISSTALITGSGKPVTTVWTNAGLALQGQTTNNGNGAINPPEPGGTSHIDDHR
jgi:Flp pilus assembly pilin Flp